MDLERLRELFGQLEKLTGVRDIAYHRIEGGRLNPVLKTHTDILGVEKWKSVHAQNPVYIERDRLLRELVRDPRPITVQDVKNDPRSAEEFFLFGIDSILILPVVENAAVKGIVVVASIGQLHEFTDEEVREAQRLVEGYREIFRA
ncbi:MAG: GAF domain-containing protein [Cohnella sp.]|jgi:acetolactate synthase-1/2/3 large subunit|uniref:GAF domain-containing protein n=1 Tax=Cohnella sp. TaxID=1883426 RepID=UPI000E3631B3|nr:GAF domain-containing protein [Cohnella sp.]REK64970.1 MAG: GAF domain-containing protein [Cohnella sp.]